MDAGVLRDRPAHGRGPGAAAAAGAGRRPTSGAARPTPAGSPHSRGSARVMRRFGPASGIAGARRSRLRSTLTRSFPKLMPGRLAPCGDPRKTRPREHDAPGARRPRATVSADGAGRGARWRRGRTGAARRRRGRSRSIPARRATPGARRRSAQAPRAHRAPPASSRARRASLRDRPLPGHGRVRDAVARYPHPRRPRGAAGAPEGARPRGVHGPPRRALAAWRAERARAARRRAP